MKRLSINDIAKASLRTGKRAYLSLAIGIFLSIFLVTTVFMSAWSVYLDIQEEEARRFGRQDFLLKEGDVSDERLMSEGHFEALGHVYVNAFVGETDRTVGWYDEAAAEIIYRQVIEGRMPERAGEIALERSVLEEMRKGGEVGDVIHLPLTPVDGVREEHTFTLVGILDERTSEWNLFYSDGDIPFPSALISPEEPGFLSGRKVIHRVMTLASGWEGDVLRYWTTQDNGEHGNLFGCLYTINTWGGFERRWENMQQELNYTPFLLALISMTTLMIAFIGIALLIAAGVGISQAMESRLLQRTEQIGMLRAVGATKRQIRKIFGRETWLMMLILTPLGVAAGCAAAYVLSLCLPEQMIFGLDLRLLAPIVLVSALTILLSANLPLRRASSIAPMGVIRDVGLLRRAKKIKGKKSFRPERLMIARQLKLYPSRHIGSIALIALMLFSVMMAALLGSVEAGLAWKEMAEFRLYSVESPGKYNQWDFGLSESDLNQISALEAVEHLSLIRDYEDSTYLLVDEPAEYFKSTLMTSNLHLYEGDEMNPKVLGMQFRSDPEGDIQKAAQEHQETQQALGVDKTLVQFRVNSVNLTAQQAEALAPYVVEGKIDIEALNAGREVMVFAPTEYEYINWKFGGFTTTFSPSEDADYELIAVRENDAFRVGQRLDLLQIKLETTTDYGMGAHLAGAEHQNVSMAVGAVLSCPNDEVYEILGTAMSPTIITTEQGAKAMGLYRGWLQDIGVHLSGEIDLETEEYLEKRISAIGMRAGGYELWTNLKTVREEEESQRQMVIAFVSMGVVFLAVSVSLIAGNMRRRIRSDKRMIGTLRAVGADARMLTRSYSGQMTLAMIAGLFVGLIVMSIALPALGERMYGYNGALLKALAMMSGFAVLCWLACDFSLRRTLKEVMSRSVVENIREL